MKQRFILFNRAGVYYSEDTTTHQQISLRTKDEAEALTLLHSKNEAHRQPVLNLHIARTYLTAADPEIAKRTWQAPMDEMTRTKTGPTLVRYTRAMKDPAFDLIRNQPILETQSVQLLKVLQTGSVATNVFPRRIHNFALGMNWPTAAAATAGIVEQFHQALAAYVPGLKLPSIKWSFPPLA